MMDYSKSGKSGNTQVSDKDADELAQNLAANADDLSKLDSKEAQEATDAFADIPLPEEPGEHVDPTPEEYPGGDNLSFGPNRGKEPANNQATSSAPTQTGTSRVTQPGMPTEAKNQVNTTSKQLHHAADDQPSADLQSTNNDPNVKVTPGPLPSKDSGVKKFVKDAAVGGAFALGARERFRQKRLQKEREERIREEQKRQAVEDANEKKESKKYHDEDKARSERDVQQNHQRQTRNRRVNSEKTPMNKVSKPVSKQVSTKAEQQPQTKTQAAAVSVPPTNNNELLSTRFRKVAEYYEKLAKTMDKASQNDLKRGNELNAAWGDWTNDDTTARTLKSPDKEQLEKSAVERATKALSTSDRLPVRGNLDSEFNLQMNRIHQHENLVNIRRRQAQKVANVAHEIANGFTAIEQGRDKNGKILETTQQQVKDFNESLGRDSKEMNQLVDNQMEQVGGLSRAVKYVEAGLAKNADPRLFTTNKKDADFWNVLRNNDPKDYGNQVLDTFDYSKASLKTAKGFAYSTRKDQKRTKHLIEDALKPVQLIPMPKHDAPDRAPKAKVDTETRHNGVDNNENYQPKHAMKFTQETKKNLPIVAPMMGVATASRGAKPHADIERKGIESKTTEPDDQMREHTAETAKGVSDAAGKQWADEVKKALAGQQAAMQDTMKKFMKSQEKIITKQQEQINALQKQLQEAQKQQHRSPKDFVNKWKDAANARHERMANVSSRDILFEGTYRAGRVVLHVAKDVAIAAAAVAAGALYAGHRALHRGGKKATSIMDRAMLNTVDDAAARNKAAEEGGLSK